MKLLSHVRSFYFIRLRRSRRKERVIKKIGEFALSTSISSFHYNFINNGKGMFHKSVSNVLLYSHILLFPFFEIKNVQNFAMPKPLEYITGIMVVVVRSYRR